jgi:hypothetical protein
MDNQVVTRQNQQHQILPAGYPVQFPGQGGTVAPSPQTGDLPPIESNFAGFKPRRAQGRGRPRKLRWN